MKHPLLLLAVIFMLLAHLAVLIAYVLGVE